MQASTCREYLRNFRPPYSLAPFWGRARQTHLRSWSSRRRQEQECSAAPSKQTTGHRTTADAGCRRRPSSRRERCYSSALPPPSVTVCTLHLGEPSLTHSNAPPETAPQAPVSPLRMPLER